MTAEALYTARNNLSELERLNEFLSRFCAENRLPDEFVMEASLVLEEVFANVVMYGYRDSAEHEIVVRLALENGAMILALEDDGIAFNPLDAPPVDTTLPIEQRPVGGLGIHLVRSIMSDVKYSRKDGHNCLEMRKEIPRSEGLAG